MSLTWRLIPFSSLVAQAWKNGQGQTRQIALQPDRANGDGFLWRISAADVATDSMFSEWPGIDRHLVVTHGGPLRLTSATGMQRVLAPWQCFSFAGETRFECRLLAGPVRDFNLMLRRGRAQGRILPWSGTRTFRICARHHLWYCAYGSCIVTGAGLPGAMKLGAGDSMLVRAPRQDFGALVSLVPAADGATMGVEARIDDVPA